MFARDLERCATTDRLRSDNEKRRGAAVCSTSSEQSQIHGENKPLALTLSPFGGERELERSSWPLPELFQAAGCQFEFSAKTIQPIAKMLWEEPEKP
jgi:hypothetical protein